MVWTQQLAQQDYAEQYRAVTHQQARIAAAIARTTSLITAATAAEARTTALLTASIPPIRDNAPEHDGCG